MCKRLIVCSKRSVPQFAADVKRGAGAGTIMIGLAGRLVLER
jgi:hypothetical protein